MSTDDIQVIEKEHIEIAKLFADKFNFDQVVIIARRVSEGPSGMELVVTYGKGKDHSLVAEKIGNFLKYRVMKWNRSN